jgi:hypothetical protein
MGIQRHGIKVKLRKKHTRTDRSACQQRFHCFARVPSHTNYLCVIHLNLSVCHDEGQYMTNKLQVNLDFPT